MAEPDWSGMDKLLSPNIIGNLPSGRPIVRNLDGSISTHRNTIANFDKDFYVIPTIYGGKQFSVDDAIEHIKKNNFVDPDTGQPLKAYTSLDEAKAAEDQQHGLLNEIAGMLQKSSYRVP